MVPAGSVRTRVTPLMRHKSLALLLSIESWLFNRDPYVMAYDMIPI